MNIRSTFYCNLFAHDLNYVALSLSRAISRAGGTAGWLWNLLPGTAERLAPRSPGQPDRPGTSDPGTASPPPRCHSERHPGDSPSGPPPTKGGIPRSPRQSRGDQVRHQNSSCDNRRLGPEQQ
jgi:hypothetical protein